MQLVGRRFAEHRLLEIGMVFERSEPGRPLSALPTLDGAH